MFVSKIVLSLTLFVQLHIRGIHGEGRLLEPVARSTAWRLGLNTHTNYDDHSLNCGGGTKHEPKRGFKCGACGDPYNLSVPRPNENGGKYSRDLNGNVYIVRKYEPGQKIEIKFIVTANYGGDAEFSICRLNSDREIETEACFNKHPLEIEYIPEVNDNCRDQPFKNRIKVCRGKNNYQVTAKLPAGLICDHCVLRWHYRSSKDWNMCLDGTFQLGCGPEEIFRGCSDISIGMQSKNSSSGMRPGPTLLNFILYIFKILNLV